MSYNLSQIEGLQKVKKVFVKQDNSKNISMLSKYYNADENIISWLYYKYGNIPSRVIFKEIDLFRKYLCVDYNKAAMLYKSYGRGYVYSNKTSVVMEYTTDNRFRMESRYGDIVIIAKDGKVSRIKEGSIKRFKQRERAKSYKRKEQTDEPIKDVMHWVNQEGDIFYIGQGKPSPKHAGRANSLDDLGKYVDRPSTMKRPISGSWDVFQAGYMSDEQRAYVRKGELSKVGAIKDRVIRL